MPLAPTEEQNRAISQFKTGEPLKISAFAGAGKTSTLRFLADTHTRALEIAEANRNGPRRNVVMSQGNKWYDISHMTEAEIMSSVSAARH
jgi:hypothetical protein